MQQLLIHYKYLLFLVLFSLPYFSLAQSMDKLTKAIEQASNDSTKAALLLQYGNTLAYKAPQKARIQLEKGLDILKNRATASPNLYVSTLNTIALTYRVQGLPDSAKFIFRQAIEYASIKKDSHLLAKSYSNLATAYADLEVYDSTTIFDLKALDIREKIHSSDVGKSYNNLGYDYKKRSMFKQALMYYKKALKHKIENKQTQSIGNTYLNIGNIFIKQAKYDSVVTYYNKALESARATKDSLFLGQVLHSFGLFHVQKKEFVRAKSYLEKALAVFRSLQRQPNPRFILPTYQELAKVYLEFNQLNKAEQLLKKVEQFLLQNDLAVSYRMELNYKVLERLYWQKGAYQKAKEYSEKGYKLIDTLHNRELNQKVHTLLTKYSVKLKKNRIKQLEQAQKIKDLELQQASRQQFYFVLIILLMLVMVGVLIWVNRWRARTNQELKELNNTKDKLFSIIAHDLKNPLSAFRSITQALSDDIFEISREDLGYFIKRLNTSANNLFDLLQNLLYWSIAQSGRLSFAPQSISAKTSVDKLFELLSPSAKIKKLKLVNQVPSALDIYVDTQMFQAVLRNLVSNAIKFTPTGGEVRVVAQRQQDTIHFSVIDTGVGMTAQTMNSLFDLHARTSSAKELKNKGTGLGLLLCKDFVEKHGGQIWVESKMDEGSTFSFSIPIKNK